MSDLSITGVYRHDDGHRLAVELSQGEAGLAILDFRYDPPHATDTPGLEGSDWRTLYDTKTDEGSTALQQAVTAAERARRTAAEAGAANAHQWLLVAAHEIRALLPTAHTLRVDTSTWADNRGSARPDIREVHDATGTPLWDEADTTEDGVALSDAINEVCTTLDHALRYCDPWTAEAWQPTHGPTCHDCSDYTVTLPDTPA